MEIIVGDGITGQDGGLFVKTYVCLEEGVS